MATQRQFQRQCLPVCFPWRMDQRESLFQPERSVLIPLRYTIAPVFHSVGLRLRGHRLCRIQSIAISVAARLQHPTKVVAAHLSPLPRELHYQSVPLILAVEALAVPMNPVARVVLSQRRRDGTPCIG